MKKPDISTLFLDDFPQFRNDQLSGRYLTFPELEPELKKLSSYYTVEETGRSVLNTPIHSVSFGKGKIKILAWSQMHGNESTTTKAVFDLFNLFHSREDLPEVTEILENCTIKVIPMLNPDGAVRYTRENVNSVDLNRDAQELSQVESRILRKCFDEFKPDYCFNLHDQRTIFSAGDSDKPATLSFLTPSMDEERSLKEERIESMQIIGAINDVIQEYLPGQVGRYDDAFNLNCTGDSFQSLQVPTILFEAGHYKGDYQREETRKYMSLAIFTALLSVADGSYRSFSVDSYFRIPENQKNFFDILLRNALVEGELVDVAIQFQEKVKARRIAFVPVVQLIGPKLPYYGHRSIDCEAKEVTHSDGKSLLENDIAEAILLNKGLFSLKIE